MKGNIVLELGIMLVLIIVVAVALFAGSVLQQSFLTKTAGKLADQSPIVESGYALDAIANGFLFLVVGLFAAAFIAAFIVGEHPVFAFITIILLYVMTIITAAFSNFFQSFASKTVFAYQVGQFNIVVTIMTNLPVIFFVLGSVLIIVLYAKGGVK